MYNIFNNLQWLHDVHMIVHFMVTVVLFPDPTLEERKGSGEHRYSYVIMLTDWIQALYGPVGMHHSARTENLAKVHESRRPLFSSSRVKSGDETMVIVALDSIMSVPNIYIDKHFNLASM